MKYYVQEYTCEDGAIAKILIPDTATLNDVLGFREFIDVILKYKYKTEDLKRNRENVDSDM